MPAALPAGLKPAILDPSGHLVLDSVDADTNIVVASGSTTSTLTELGLPVGTADPTNLLTQHMRFGQARH